MKRRNFILVTTTAALAVASVPTYRYFKKKYRYAHPLTTPDDLSRFCNEKEIYEIGKAYRNMMPAENDKMKLTGLLLSGGEGKLTKDSDDIAVFEMLQKKIQKDFSEYNLQVVRGWVISTTEARQCALFSLT